MKKEVKKSPIFYMGNKERLIKKGLLELFPKEIGTLIEPFCGSGVVSINVKANKYLMNDNNQDVIGLLNLFKENNEEQIIEHINKRVEEFNLNKSGEETRTTDNNPFVRDFYKEKYNNFRKFYNETFPKNILDLYTLTFYSHSNITRFSGVKEEGNMGDFRKFNVSFGNGNFDLNKHGEKIKNGCEFFSQKNVFLNNKDYKEMFEAIDSDTFIYCDPPYLNTLAVYNEKRDCGGWNIDNDYELFASLKTMNDRGVKFGLSNVYENKGKVNQHLIDWVEENGFNVHFFKDFNYTAMGKGNANTTEVYICNY